MSESNKSSTNDVINLRIRDASKMLEMISADVNDIDLFHANCEGCEWEMMENILDPGIHEKMKVIQIGTHFFSQVENLTSRFCKIRERLNQTHHMVSWGQPFVWERWVRNPY